MSDVSAAAFADTKPHYNILDGLRGVAALTVCAFTCSRLMRPATSTSGSTTATWPSISSSILSGFVIGYAYDDRWTKMTVGEFLKRRFIRLHRWSSSEL